MTPRGVGAAVAVITALAASGCATPEGDPRLYHDEDVSTLGAAHSAVETVEITLVARLRDRTFSRAADDAAEVRLSRGPGGLQTYVVDGLVVRPGARASLLGFDRREVNGPWLVHALVGLANRKLGYVPWHAVRRVDWEQCCVEVLRVDPLTDERPAR